MTKKKLNWRLTDLPTAGEVAELVDSGVITKEEARDILFNEKDNESAQVDELKRQIEFLEKIIENVSLGHRTILTYTPALPQYTYWRRNPNIWMSTAGSRGMTTSYSANTSKLIS